MNSEYFSEWVPRFIQYLKMRNYSGKTLISYNNTLTRFGHYLWLTRNGAADIYRDWNQKESLRLETEVEVTPVEITDYLSFLTRGRDYHAATLNRILSSLSSFYRFLMMQDILSTNPVPRIDRPRMKEKELKYLKHSQVLRLLRSIPDTRDRLIIRIIYATGVRVSELCAIQVEDIDFDDLVIRVRGKGGKIRMVFVDQETLDEIEEAVGNRLSGPLFYGQQGKSISPRTVQHIFNKFAPPGITPHKIRHSYASELYRRSKNLRVVQENLGHSSIKTTEIYLHTDLDERQKVYRDFFPLSNSRKSDE